MYLPIFNILGIGLLNSLDDETKQDDSKGRKTNKQSHVDVDVTITNKNKSTSPGVKHL
jgi:hypothetical protein